jgi:hypothetical protein
MESALSELLARWPVPVVAGVLFYALWVPIVLVASAMTYTRNRLRLMPPISAYAGDWKRAIWFLLLLGLPVALGFGVLFALHSTAVLIAVVATITILLVGFLLPRLNRW